MFAIIAIIPPQFVWGKAIEKQVGQVYPTQSDAESALPYVKVPGASLHVRELPKLDPKIVQAEVAAKEATKAIEKVRKLEKTAFKKDVTSLAKAMLVAGNDQVLQGLPIELASKIRDRHSELLAKVSSKKVPMYKPLAFAGLARAIGVRSLDEIAPFPNRPDDVSGLTFYLQQCQTFLKMLNRRTPVITSDFAENALNRQCINLAIRRLEVEIQTVAFYSQARRVDAIVGEACLSCAVMPPWPVNRIAIPEASNSVPAVAVAKAEPKAKHESLTDGPRVIRRKKANSAIKQEMGDGFADLFNKKPVCASRDFSRGSLSSKMSCKNYVAKFSQG